MDAFEGQATLHPWSILWQNEVGKEESIISYILPLCTKSLMLVIPKHSIWKKITSGGKQKLKSPNELESDMEDHETEVKKATDKLKEIMEKTGKSV